ncbi:MAG: GDSL-type esterase/lipase family protein [Rhodothermales bacterium]
MADLSRERIFTAVLVFIPIALLLLLEVSLRVVGFAEERRHAFKAVENESGWTGFNPEYPSRYFRGFLPNVGFTPFREEKPENGVRVVVLGGSSTAGFPFQWYHGFPAGLERRLMGRFAGQPVEVINLGMTAVNSYTLLDLTRHVIRMEPDLVVIYAGHNEFYGAYGAGTTADWMPKSPWFGRTILTLKRSALVLALEYLLLGPPDYGLEPGSNDRTLMARVVQNAGIELDGEIYRAGIGQFTSNMNRVLDHFQSAHIPVLAGTLVGNLSGQQPLSQTADALAAFSAAEVAMAEGDTLNARNLFETARDLDQIRFRASGELNDIIRSWAERPGVEVEDLEVAFNRASASGIPGYDLFTDHLHPTHEGYELMADAFSVRAASMLEAKTLDAGNLGLDWETPILDELSAAESGILIDRLLADYPFNLDADPESSTSTYAAKLRERQESGRIGDSLAVAIMVSPLATQNALLEGAQLHLAQGDSAEALRYYHSLFYWQPFNAALMEEVIGRFLASSTLDPLVEKLALQGASRSDRLYFWNALAATQLRQSRLEAAEVALKQAERIDAQSAIMLYNRARLEYSQGDTAAARSTLEAYRAASSAAN